jgi:nucleoside diphosphate kinase
MVKKKTIKKRVLGEIFDDWDNKGVEVARDKLKKMYFSEYDMLTYIEERRLILHNLIVAEIEIGRKNGLEVYEMSQVKFYTSILKNDMDNEIGYKEGDNACLYARVLINYIESHKKELTRKEIIEGYEFCYHIYENIEDKNDNGYLNKLVAKFDLNLAKENFSIVLEILEDILHNNNTEYEKKFNELIKEIKTVNELLYNKVLLLKQSNIIQAI